MKSKRFFINKSILLNSLNQQFFTLLLFTGALIISTFLPFYLMLQNELGTDRSIRLDVLFSNPNAQYFTDFMNYVPWIMFIIILGNILLTCLIYYPLYKKESAVLLLSYPIPRGTIYRSLGLSAILVFSLSIGIAFGVILIVALIKAPFYISGLISIFVLLYLVGLLTISLMLFSGSVTGNTVMQNIMAFSIVILPSILIFMINLLYATFINGYIGYFSLLNFLFGSEFSSLLLNFVSPYLVFYHWSTAFNTHESIGIWRLFSSMHKELLLVVLQICIFQCLGNIAFNKRKAESIDWIQPLWLKRLVLVTSSLLFAFLFAYIDILKLFRHNNLLNIIIGGFLGMLFGYLIGSYISWESLYFKRPFKIYLREFLFNLIALLSILVFLLAFGQYSYNVVPNPANIEYVELYLGNMDEMDANSALNYEYYDPEEISSQYFTDHFLTTYKHHPYNSFEQPENIRYVLDLMNNRYRSNHSSSSDLQGIYVVYHMKNGKIDRRFYENALNIDKEKVAMQTSNLSEPITYALIQLFSSSEFRDKNNDILRYNPNYISKIELRILSDDSSSKKSPSIILTEKEKINEFIRQRIQEIPNRQPYFIDAQQKSFKHIGIITYDGKGSSVHALVEYE